jgi:putative nucleotidyltransferase with HDIG domain
MVRTGTQYVETPGIADKAATAGGASRDILDNDAPRRTSVRRAAGSRARPYVLAVLCAGCAVFAISASELWDQPPPMQWWVLVALTLVSGSAVLKIPSVPVNFSISDVFTLTSAVVFGPAAGTAIVAFDSLVISTCLARSGLPVERILFNAAAPPVAMWLSASTFFHASGMQPLYGQPLALEIVGPWLLVFAALYFCLNTLAIAVAIALHERVSAFGIWRAHFQNLWFTFIGGALGAAFVVFALQLGRYGIVVLSFPLLLALILHFAYRHATGRVDDQLRHLAQVNRLNLSTIEALAHAIDAKDGVTHDHIRRVQRRAVALAERIGVDDELQLRAIEAAALLHDIGKLAIPEHILNKPGKLTPAEFERMKTHARVGAEILSEVDFPYPVVPIVRHHHESWDGTGYPDGLRGSDIPIGARILAVVDCFDALTSDRPYRRALPVCEALEIIQSRSGTMYEPAIVDAFRALCAAASDVGSVDVPAPIEQPVTPEATRESSSGTAAARLDDAVRVAMALGASLSRRPAGRCRFRVLSESLCELPGVDTVAVFATDPTTVRLVLVCASGRHAHAFDTVVIPVGERMSGWVAAVGEPMIDADAALDLFDAAAGSLRSAAAIPCTSEHGERLVISLYSTHVAAFAPVHRHLIETAVSLLTSDETDTRASEQTSERRPAARRLLHRRLRGGNGRHARVLLVDPQP